MPPKRGDASTPKQPSRSILARAVQRLFPQRRPSYGAIYLPHADKKPRGIRHRLYKLFPPPLQTDVGWYAPSLTSKIKEHGDFYCFYIGLETEEALIKHIHTIRDRVWAIAPYPCIGRDWFLLPGLSGMKEWPEVVEAAKEGKRILDLGCGLGQDLRRLYSETGIDAANMNLYASDVSQKMWDMGCELFLDHEKPVAKFLRADATIFQPYGNPGPLEELRGKVDVILMSQLLDFFHRHDQVNIGKTIVELSHVGTKVIGRTLGAEGGARIGTPLGSCEGDGSPDRMYHDVHQLKGLWFDISQDTKTSWKVEVEEVDFDRWGLDENDIAWLKEPPPKGLPCILKGLSFVIERER